MADEGWNNPGDLKDSEPFPHAMWIRTQGTLGVSLSPYPSGPLPSEVSGADGFFLAEDKTRKVVVEERGIGDPVTVRPEPLAPRRNTDLP